MIDRVITLNPSIQKGIEDLEDELASLQFDIDSKHHSAMERISVLDYTNKLKREKVGLELALKFINKSEAASL